MEEYGQTYKRYDNKTIASTLKRQIWIATNNRDVPRVMKTKFLARVVTIWAGFKSGPHHATSHLRSRLESQRQSVPGCDEECGDPLLQSGGRLKTLGVAAGLGAGPKVQRNPGLSSEGVLRLCTLLSLPPPSPARTRWTTSFGHTSRTSTTWPPTTPKPARSPPSAEYSSSSQRKRWMIKSDGERELGKSMLTAPYDYDNDISSFKISYFVFKNWTIL